MESVNLSFLRRTLHTAHDRIHMFLLPELITITPLDSLVVVSDASALSFDCQTNVLQLSRTQRPDAHCVFPVSKLTSTFNLVHNDCSNRSHTVSLAIPTTRSSCLTRSA